MLFFFAGGFLEAAADFLADATVAGFLDAVEAAFFETGAATTSSSSSFPPRPRGDSFESSSSDKSNAERLIGFLPGTDAALGGDLALEAVAASEGGGRAVADGAAAAFGRDAFATEGTVVTVAAFADATAGAMGGVEIATLFFGRADATGTGLVCCVHVAPSQYRRSEASCGSWYQPPGGVDCGRAESFVAFTAIMVPRRITLRMAP